jgi:MFS transporter, UMF1 family
LGDLIVVQKKGLFVNKKSVVSWALYDWANSAFATTVMAGFFPVFFKQYWSQGIDPTVSTARLGSIISISSLIIALVSPLLGALADSRGYKKMFTFIFMLVGVVSTASLAFIESGLWLTAAFAYGIAMMGFNASCVFNDALLPSVAAEKDMDRVSSLGYGLGYLGGGVLFLLNVVMYLNPTWFGLADGVAAVKVSFFTVGIWWFVFTLPVMKNVLEPKVLKNESLWISAGKSFQEILHTIKDLTKHRNLMLFMLAYWLYIDGVYTVMTMAVDYGIALGFESSSLITALLITQFIGFPFAIFFGWLASKWGCRGPVLIAIAVYMATVVAATYMTKASEFYLLATVIGMVQGGVQALSRSLFGKMVPKESAGQYFGLFNLIGKFASILGPLVVGLTAYITNSSRYSMLGLLSLFIVGSVLLGLVREPRQQKV